MNLSGTSVKIGCPGCGAALSFDPESGKMKCAHCGGFYDPDELRYEKTPRSSDLIECKVYVCSACGAELNINDTECSTFCAYCGQPTVVFDRIAAMKKPEYIIPFSVTKKRAVELMREKLKSGDFVPEALKNVEMERVSGVYIPFWLYDIEYSDEQYIVATKGGGKRRRTYYYYMAAERRFSGLTLDGAVRLNDALSRRLEPYDLSGMKEFDMDYLSGFYSDRFDADPADLEKAAVARARELFDKETCAKVCEEDGVEGAKIQVSAPAYAVTGTSYALFPAWFLTFRYKDAPYTILVNGQTEKAVGGLPADIWKFVLKFLSASIFTVPLAILFDFVVRTLVAIKEGEDAGEMSGMIATLILGGVLVCEFIANLRALRRSKKLTSATSVRLYAANRERQNGDNV